MAGGVGLRHGGPVRGEGVEEGGLGAAADLVERVVLLDQHHDPGRRRGGEGRRKAAVGDQRGHHGQGGGQAPRTADTRHQTSVLPHSWDPKLANCRGERPRGRPADPRPRARPSPPPNDLRCCRGEARRRVGHPRQPGRARCGRGRRLDPGCRLVVGAGGPGRDRAGAGPDARGRGEPAERDDHPRQHREVRPHRRPAAALRGRRGGTAGAARALRRRRGIVRVDAWGAEQRCVARRGSRPSRWRPAPCCATGPGCSVSTPRRDATMATASPPTGPSRTSRRRWRRPRRSSCAPGTPTARPTVGSATSTR